MATASLIIDIVIALVCVIIIIKNAARGFIKSFMVFARTVLAILTAYIFNAPIARLFDDKIFNSLAQGWTIKAFESTVNEEGLYQVSRVFDGIPNWASNYAIGKTLDEETLNKFFIDCSPATYDEMTSISTAFGNTLSWLISAVVSFIVLFIVAEIVVAIVGALLNKLGKVPMLKVLNIILGACIGIVISAVTAWLIALAVKWVIYFGNSYYPDIFSNEILENSIITKFFLENDLWQWTKEHLKINITI